MAGRIESTCALLDLIRERTAMYIGGRDLGRIRAFLSGFWYARDADCDPDPSAPHFRRFPDYVAEHFGWYESTVGWERIIGEESPDSDTAVDTFYALLDSLREAEECCISRVEMQSHHQATGAVKTRTRFRNGTSTSLRPRDVPGEIKLMRFWSTESCYLVYVYPSNWDVDHYFKTINEAKQYAGKEFGVSESEWCS